MFYLVLSCLGIYFGYVDVESAQSGMSVAAEVQVAIGTEGRKHLVARSVDRFAKAPEAKIAEEKEKLAKYEQMMEQVTKRLEQLA